MFFFKRRYLFFYFFGINLGYLLGDVNKEHAKNYLYPFVEKRLINTQEERFLRPIGCQYKDEVSENYFLPPFGRDHQAKEHIYWSNFFGLFNYDWRFSSEKNYREGSFFPIYFFKKGYGSKYDYAAIWPLGGTIKNFFGKDQSDWFLWPMWVRTYKGEQINYWMPWPFINIRKGDSKGLGLWPLGGHFYKENYFDERYILWPFFYRHQYWKPQKNLKTGFLPFYAYEKSDNIEDLSIIWPIWGRRWEKNPHYEEYRILWPLWVQGDGDCYYVNRWAPFYTYSENKIHKSNKKWLMWPFIKQQNWIEKSVAIHQEQFLYFLFWHQEQKNLNTGEFLGNKTHFWPFYSYWDDGKGREQIQMLSPFEVFFQNNKVIRELYTPLFNLYRYEKNNDEIYQSFLFNCFYEKNNPLEKYFKFSIFLEYKNTPQEKRFSLLKGFLEYKKEKGEKTFRFFWITLKKNHKRSRELKML